MKLSLLLIIGLILLTACEIKEPTQQTSSENTTTAEPINQTNSTSETTEIIIVKDIDIFTPRKENLTMYVLDIEGDAVIFQFGDKAILVNSGFEDDSEKVLKSIRDLGIERVDYIFATNTKPKNIGGMPYMILRTDPLNIVENGISSSLDSYKEYKQLYNETIVIQNDRTFQLDDFFVRVLIGYDDGYGFSTNLDDNSLVLNVQYGNSNFLLMSDCSLDCEEKIKNDGIQADVIKISHSCSATSLTFLQRVNPTWAIVSTTQENFCPQVVQRFKNLNIPLHSTFDEGDIFITTDGLDYKIDWKKDG